MHVSVQRLTNAFGEPLTRPTGVKWYARHDASGRAIGDLEFTTRKAGQEFVAAHLDPANPKWKDDLESMAAVYRAAIMQHR